MDIASRVLDLTFLAVQGLYVQARAECDLWHASEDSPAAARP